MKKKRSIAEFLTSKGDPIGEFFGRVLLLPLARLFWPTSQEQQSKAETIRAQDDTLMRLRISTDPPEVWKSLLWWTIFLVGMGLAMYVSMHLAMDGRH